jgi:hypothetical protein
VWSSTAQIPKLYTESYAIASKQFTTALSDLRKLYDAVLALEKDLEINKAPYTPGRWPEWTGE